MGLRRGGGSGGSRGQLLDSLQVLSDQQLVLLQCLSLLLLLLLLGLLVQLMLIELSSRLRLMDWLLALQGLLL